MFLVPDIEKTKKPVMKVLMKKLKRNLSARNLPIF